MGYMTDITDPPSVIDVEGVAGFDGHGQNSIFRSCNNKGDSHILGGSCINSIHDSDKNLIYEELSLGPDSEIPTFIIPHKEDHELIDKCFTRLNKEVNFVNNNSIHTNIHGKQ